MVIGSSPSTSDFLVVVPIAAKIFLPLGSEI